MTDFFTVLQPLIKPSTTCWVAYSGGVDSHVLLHALTQLRGQNNFLLRAVHIHHGLNPKADAWQLHCEKICRELDIELTVRALDMQTLSVKNIEARARALRYLYFSSLLSSNNNSLLTGHHQDDQAETLLLQLMRGAGPKGMAAMPVESTLGAGKLIRPFLGVSRKEILSYAQAQQLVWIEDDSNGDTRFSRNFIRHQVMPLLAQRWPNAAETIARSAKHCAETENLLEEYIKPLAQSCLSSKGLSIRTLKNLAYAQQKHVIRYWLSQTGVVLPNELKLTTILRVFLTAGEDKNPQVAWGSVELRRYQDDLIILKALSVHDARQVFSWQLASPLVINSLNVVLSAHANHGVGIKISLDQSVEIRFRQENARVTLVHRQGSRTLKKCFQEWRVPVWERDRVPLLYVDNKLAAIVGYAICKEFLVEAGEVGVVIDVMVDDKRV